MTDKEVVGYILGIGIVILCALLLVPAVFLVLAFGLQYFWNQIAEPFDLVALTYWQAISLQAVVFILGIAAKGMSFKVGK